MVPLDRHDSLGNGHGSGPWRQRIDVGQPTFPKLVRSRYVEDNFGFDPVALHNRARRRKAVLLGNVANRRQQIPTHLRSELTDTLALDSHFDHLPRSAGQMLNDLVQSHVHPTLALGPHPRRQRVEMFLLARYLNCSADRQQPVLPARRHVRGYEHVRLAQIQPHGSLEYLLTIAVVLPLGAPDPSHYLRRPTRLNEPRQHWRVMSRILPPKVTDLTTADPNADGIPVMLVVRLRNQFGHRLDLFAVLLEISAKQVANRRLVMRLTDHLDAGVTTLAPQIEWDRHDHTVDGFGNRHTLPGRWTRAPPGTNAVL